MTQAPIPFIPNQQSGLEELSGAVASAINVVIDGAGAVRRRPGVRAFSGVLNAAGLEGLHATATGRLYAVSSLGTQRSIYRVASDGTASNLSVGADAELSGTARPVVAETEAMLAIAGGLYIQRVYLSDDTSARLNSADAPQASHVIANSSRLLANNLPSFKNQINYSDAGSGTATTPHETWVLTVAGAAGLFTGEARPDPTVALGENSSDVFAFGSTSLQIYAPDSTLIYSSVSALEYGLIAPYAVAKVDGDFYWLDHMRRVVKSDGRAVEVISQPIQRTLDELGTVSDAFAYRVKVGSVDAVAVCFPTDGRTFVYQVGMGWSLWMGWDDTTDNFKRLSVNCAAYAPTEGVQYVGTVDGSIGTLQMGTYADATGSSSERIVGRVRSGYITRDTDSRKSCTVARLAFRRGETASDTETTVSVRWRDDGGEWTPPYRIGLGVSGDTDPVVELRSLGVYRRRQWEIELAGDEEIVLASATEEFEILGV